MSVCVGTLAQLQALQEERDVEDETEEESATGEKSAAGDKSATGEKGACCVTGEEMVNIVAGEGNEAKRRNKRNQPPSKVYTVVIMHYESGKEG